MTTKTVYYTTELTVLACGDCGVPFGMSDDFVAERQKSHATFYCPNGHSRYYPAENEAERYKRLYKDAADRSARLVAERDQAEASRRAWKGQATKARNRAAAGECRSAVSIFAISLATLGANTPSSRLP